jgi:hypothetical protein
MKQIELTDADIRFLQNCHIADPCDEVDEATTQSFDEVAYQFQRRLLEQAAGRIVDLARERDTYRNWFRMCAFTMAAVILMQLLAFGGWL